MIRLAICDDDQHISVQIENYIEELREIFKDQYNVEIYDSGERLLKALQTGERFNIIFMDIQMGGINGIETGRKTKFCNSQNDPLLIYVSGFDNQLAELFEVNAFRFLYKPINKEKFRQYLLEACEEIAKTNQEMFEYKDRKIIRKIPLCEVIYLESSGHTVSVVTTKESLKIYTSLDLLCETNNLDFIAIHKSIRVNPRHITILNYSEVTLSNGERKPISESRRKEIRQSYFESKSKHRGG